ncbi:MAG: M24 family metallopeptidase [Bacteroidales bacterium]|nr:M24 family metallopeptidase [Bacteroidales bacterium]
MKKLIFTILAAGIMLTAAAQTRDIDKATLTQRQQTELFNKNLEWKLDNVLPPIMKRENIDMWIIINFEYAEDPVYQTLNTWPGDGARRLSILVFHDAPDGFKKLSATWHGASASGYMYESIFSDRASGAEAQFTAVAEYIKKADPKSIGINYDPSVLDDFSHANGLSHLHYERLYNALDKKYRDRLVSAKKVVMGWFETRTPWEVDFFRHMCGIGHDLIKEFFSNAVITPGVTTSADVQWWITERIKEKKLDYWFFPSIDIRRSDADREKYGASDNIIRPGDMLHCDVGITYMGMTTDMQHNAYVLRPGETDAPAGLKALFEKHKRFQDISLEEMKEGRTGNEILKAVLDRGKAEGLNPVMYSHPVNYFGHGSGMTIGRTEQQVFLPGSGEHKLYNNTTYALEFSVAADIPEWGNQRVSLGSEENIIFTGGKARFVDGRQEKMYLIK